MTIPDLDALEAFIDESLRRSSAQRYYPTVFIEMRKQWTAKGAIERLVVAPDIQSGLRQLRDLGLLDWSLEAAAIKFPAIFRKEIRDAAQFRLDQLKAET